VHIKPAGGLERVLSFRGDERYEFPESVVFGG
jgi:hypothetical protein